jgi:branched-chain amino acid transport system permease protein
MLLLIFIGLAVAPFAFPGVKALNVAAKVLIFVVLVASFDLLLGYTGIVSFAHTMFFGIGAYGVAIASGKLGPGWGRWSWGWARRCWCRSFCPWPSACSPCACAPSSLP